MQRAEEGLGRRPEGRPCQSREKGLMEDLAKAKSEAARADAAEKELMALIEKYEAGTP